MIIRHLPPVSKSSIGRNRKDQGTSGYHLLWRRDSKTSFGAMNIIPNAARPRRDQWLYAKTAFARPRAVDGALEFTWDTQCLILALEGIQQHVVNCTYSSNQNMFGVGHLAFKAFWRCFRITKFAK